MNFVKEIVEHDVKAPEPLSFPGPGTSSGFPTITKRKPSQWRSRLQEKGISSMSNSLKLKQTLGNKDYIKNQDGLNEFVDKKDKKLNYEGLSEAERIHQENIELLSRMSMEEREEAKEELIDSLSPEILQMLLNRSMGRKASAPVMEDETGEWIGSSKEDLWGKSMDEDSVNKALGIKSDAELDKEMEMFGKKKVSFAQEPEEIIEEDVEDLNDLIPSLQQIEAQTVKEMVSNVHFPKPPTTTTTEEDDYKIDLNDPDFNEKLHEKYFPDLPRDTENLKWMEPIPESEPVDVIENIKDLRFDFQGNLVTPEESAEVPTYLGLHHHAEQPQLPGYTLSELSHYARSTFNSQRCIAIQTIGRILHKLGMDKYNFQKVDEDGAEVEEENEEDNLNNKLWDLVKDLQIIDTLKEFSDENLERNLSVRNYCIELLWLWRKGGGDKRKKEDKT